MNRIILIISVFALCACAKQIETENQLSSKKELVFTATIEGKSAETKTERQLDNAVWWSPGDAVSLFFVNGENGGNKFIAQNKTVTDRAEFKGTIDGFAGSPENYDGEFWFWGIYPYSEHNSCDGSSVYLDLPSIQYAKEGTFADNSFPTIAKAKGLELSFYNVCGGAKFILSRNDITSITFKSNGGEVLSGTARVTFPEGGYPTISSISGGKDSIVLMAPDSGVFTPGEEYFMVLPPIILSYGFTLTFRTIDGKEGSFLYSDSRSISRSIFGSLKNKDKEVTKWNDIQDTGINTPEMEFNESGLYLGITYFGSDLTHYPMQLLTEDSIDSFNEFIDSRTSLDYQTLLYYTVDKSMDRLKAAKFPDDLFSVAIVTFTDGQDDGSAWKKGLEEGKVYSEGEYEEEIESLLGESVQGMEVEAYSIGLGESNDPVFVYDLQTIAHPATNYSIFSSMTAVNDKFKSIAKEISNTIKLQKFTGTIPGQAAQTRIRFTFDNISNNNGAAATSELYIEGVFNVINGEPVLQNVVYYGLSSTSGGIVKGVITEDNRVSFTFAGLHLENNLDLNMDYYKRWIYRTKFSTWQVYDETEHDPLQNGISREMKSAAIILNLDCTMSLGEANFNLLKQYSKNFVNTLYTSSIDPEAVQKITIDPTSAELVIGEVLTLNARIIPSTAIEKTITWSSSNPDVVSVDNNGVIRALSVGVATITATAKDGGKTALCTVSVIASRPVRSVTLNKTKASIQFGKTLQLIATVLPSNATETGIIWTSSDESVATVSDSGLVSSINIGTATITATSIDGSLCSSSCEVSVTLPVNPSHLSLAVVSNDTGLKYYVSQELYAMVNLTGYTKRGIVCNFSTGSYFVLKMMDYSVQYHISGSHGLYQTVYKFSGLSANGGSRVLPNRIQAEWLAANISSLNAALQAFGGSAMSKTENYWTSEYRGNGYYYYFKSGQVPTLDSSGTMECRVREIIAL